MQQDQPPQDQHDHLLTASAQRIQSAWRRHVSRAQVGINTELGDAANGVTAEARWQEALVHAQTKRGLQSAHDGINDPRTRWKRAFHLASRLQGADSPTTSSHSNLESKFLETQHWLELTDGKHRYGSNLKYYHRRWLQADTKENFFKWLDRGEGKDLSLEECSRVQLESERITYLSADQRRNYLVYIDDRGLLRWAKTQEFVDTTAGRFKDAGNGGGIVEDDSNESNEAPRVRRHSFSGSEDDNAAANHYVSAKKESSSKFTRVLRERLTTGGVTERLLRKTVRKNTWIYVADKQMNIYIGIKNTGVFQHSSFTSGGLVVSAGLITCHSGLIHKLSPLSGHYRTEITSFRKFFTCLEELGADLHKVQRTRSELALWGVQKYNKIKKGGVKKTVKDWTENTLSGTWKLDVLRGRMGLSNEREDTQEKSSPLATDSDIPSQTSPIGQSAEPAV